MTRSLGRDGAVGIVFLVGAIAFWYLRLFLPGNEILPGADLYTQIYPMALRAADWILQGHVPLWNPFQLCGQPFLASVLYGVFYPLNFPFLLFPTAVAIEVIVVLHLFVAGVLTYLYARAVHIGRAGAALAGLTFMLSGFVAQQAMWFTPAIGACVWLPLGFLAIELLFDRPSFAGVVVLAIAVAMPVLAGWLQTWTYTMHAIGAYATLRLLALLAHSRSVRQVVRTAGLLAAGVLLGLGLAAIQVLPSAELQSLGPRRPGGLSILQTIPFGPTAPSTLLSEAVDSRPGSPRRIYIGMLPLLLMPIALLLPGNRFRAVFLWASLLWSIAVAVTVFSPLYGFYRLLPGGSWFREPSRMTFVYTFAGAVLAGMGLDYASDVSTSRRGRLTAVAVVSVLALGWLVAVSMPLRSGAFVVIGWVLLVGLLTLHASPLHSIVRSTLIGLLAVDLFLATRSPALHPLHDLQLYDEEHEAYDFIKVHQGLYRTYIHLPGLWAWAGNPQAMPKQGTLREMYLITDYEPLSSARYDKFFRLLDGYRAAEDLADPNRAPFSGFLDLAPTPAALRLLDLMSLRFITSNPRLAALQPRLVRRGSPWQVAFRPPDNHQLVYENPMVLPRAYVAHAWQVVGDGDAALSAISAASFNARHTVILESSPDVATPTPLIPSFGITAQEIASYQPTRVDIEVNDSWPGFLVLTDTFYPGWKATVDEQPTSIARANYLFRAVPVAAGHHKISFIYDPLSFKIGAAVTLAAVGCIALWAAGAAHRSAGRRRKCLPQQVLQPTATLRYGP